MHLTVSLDPQTCDHISGLVVVKLASRDAALASQNAEILKELKSMSAVTDAFAAYVTFRDQKEAAAVSAAVDAEKANHQSEVDSAVAASEASDAAVITGAMPATEPTPVEPDPNAPAA